LKTKTKKVLELLSYGAHVERYISYDRKNAYTYSIAKYLAKTMTLDKSIVKFLEMQPDDGSAARSIKNNFEQIATFSINFKAGEFSLINGISED
jgi:hypothetical protein